MKHFLAVYKPYMNRPILYRTATKVVVALALLLAWHRLYNRNEAFLLVRDGCLVPALIFIGGAWFSYLKMDGIKLNLGIGKQKKQPAPKRFNKGMEDYVETDVVNFAELSEEEQTATRFVSNLLAGLLFLAASLGAMLFA